MPQPAFLHSKLPWLVVGGIVALIALVMVYQRSRPVSGPVIAPADMTQATEDGYRPGGYAGVRPAAQPSQPLSADALRERRQAAAENRAKGQAWIDQTQAGFMSKYDSERVEPAWAAAKQGELIASAESDLIRQTGAVPTNMTADCKSTMCRVTADFPNMGMGDDWFTLYMGNLGDKVPTASYKYVENPNGTVTLQMYAVGRR